MPIPKSSWDGFYRFFGLNGRDKIQALLIIVSGVLGYALLKAVLYVFITMSTYNTKTEQDNARLRIEINEVKEHDLQTTIKYRDCLNENDKIDSIMDYLKHKIK